MKMALILLGSGIGLVAFMVIIGYWLPVSHVATRSITIMAPPDQIWAAISDFKGSVVWRSDLKDVEQVEHRPGFYVWKEEAKNGDVLTFQTLEAMPEKKLVRKIVDEGLPFGGTWTFELIGEDRGTRMTLTENGEVYNPVFRFMSRFIFGHYSSIDKYLAQLKRHFGEG